MSACASFNVKYGEECRYIAMSVLMRLAASNIFGRSVERQRLWVQQIIPELEPKKKFCKLFVSSNCDLRARVVPSQFLNERRTHREDD
jgi:oligoribonuclease (3'-5' exoribonuclease)